MSFKWTPEEEQLLRILRPTNSYAEIATEFLKRHRKGLQGFRTIRTEDAINRKCIRDNITPATAIEELETDPVEDQWETLKQLQDQWTSESVFSFRGLLPQGSIAKKILVLSDIHFPFARVDLIDSILEQESDSDIVVVNGDLLEGYAASTFEKSKRIAALDEYRLAFGFIKKLSENFPQVVLVEGNHDTRTSKHLSSFQIPKEITQVLRPNLMARIANGEELDSTGMLIRRHDFDNVYYDQRESWYVKIGKTLFIHPHNFGSSKPGWTVMKAYTDFFSKRYQPDEFDSIVCGHTHKIYKGVENSVLLIEQGCLVGLLGYSWSPKMKYTTNSQNGYAVIYQDAEGNTDFNLSGPIFLGESFPKKKDII